MKKLLATIFVLAFVTSSLAAAPAFRSGARPQDGTGTKVRGGQTQNGGQGSGDRIRKGDGSCGEQGAQQTRKGSRNGGGKGRNGGQQ